MSPQDSPETRPNHSDTSWWRAFWSVVAAAFGVQSEKNRQKDFTHSSPMPFIIGGLVFSVLFVGILVGIVSLVL